MTGAGATAIETDLPTRLDRLPWFGFHWLVVLALGITWVLDGLEVTMVSAVASVLERPTTLGLTSTQIGGAATAYLTGAIAGSLLFGHLTDHFGRKRLFLVTLGLYVIATVLTAASWDFYSFACFRLLTGAAIGGEYAAINSAIDELLPARVRGFVDLAINGSYWLGTALGAVLTVVLLDPQIVPESLGWRLAFGAGAVLTVAVALVRHYVPESPRWLILHGRESEARLVVEGIEERARAACGELAPVEHWITLWPGQKVGYAQALRVIFGRYRERAVLGLTLMVAQAFFYNAIFFTYALILTRFFGVEAEHVGYSLIVFALANFTGPLLLGRMFDTVGRRPLIVTTYAASGILLLLTGWLFKAGLLNATTQTVAWAVVFFFGSAAASSAYLTVSELFPLEIRARAIALFYSIGTAMGGLAAPALFGFLIDRGSRSEVFLGYGLGAGLMLTAALVAFKLAVAAEQRSLEQIAAPLAAHERVDAS
ncbi:MAG: MFS transporter [Myxococcales bacterium]